MTQRILVFGSSNVDLVIKLPRFHRAGETIAGENPKTFFGGKGANQAIAAKRLGGDVVFVTKLGGDDHGEEYRRYLIESGLDPKGILQEKKIPTGTAFIEVTPDGENKIIVTPGANGALTEKDLKKLGPLCPFWKTVGVFVTQAEIPFSSVKAGLKLAKKHGAVTLFNPSPPIQSFSVLFPLVDYLVLNKIEMQVLTGIKGPENRTIRKAADCLLGMGARATVITLGPDGVFFKDADEEIRLDAFRVKAIDSTAAGDAFLGGLTCALAGGKPIGESLQYASGAGALAATRLGAQPSLPFKKELDRFLSRMRA